MEKAEKDYRAILLGDVRKLLYECKLIPLSDELAYVGPFYFESDGMIDIDIVRTEKNQIEECTHAIFLLEDASCPGTIAEMVYAATLQKRLSIFYIKNEEETESSLSCACWYPIRLCSELSRSAIDIIPCADLSEASKKLTDYVQLLILTVLLC